MGSVAVFCRMALRACGRLRAAGEAKSRQQAADAGPDSRFRPALCRQLCRLSRGWRRAGPAPPLNDPLFVEIVPDEALLAVIRDGRAGTPMPPFAKQHGGALTDEQIQVIAEGIRTDWQEKDDLPASPPAYALTKGEGVQSAAGSRERGGEVFARACAGCHGANGGGVELEGVVANAINVPAFLALISDQAIRRIIITGRSDLGMPNYAESDGREANFQPLTSAEIDDLVALIADWRATGNSIAQQPAATSPTQ